MTTILKIMMCFLCVSLTYDNIIRTSVGSALGLLLPLTCRGPAAEVRWLWLCHVCSRPSGCFSNPWWQGPGPWCSLNARCRPHTGGIQHVPLTGWSAVRCKTHLEEETQQVPNKKMLRILSKSGVVWKWFQNEWFVGLIIWPWVRNKHDPYLVKCWMDFFQHFCSYHHIHSLESLYGQRIEKSLQKSVCKRLLKGPHKDTPRQ